jgi:hypothetical protein
MQSDYFIKYGYKHTYDLGDRVMGFWMGYPFVGTVANDRLANEYDGPEVLIFLDLPIKFEDTFKTIIVSKHEDIVRYN